MTRRTLDIDLNRVEGDLAIEVDVEDRVVVDARCVGTLYRGFEQIMLGRAAIDATVITPRVCGLCSTSHLYASVMALEHAWQIEVPSLATLVRDFGLMIETLQSDLRQSFLFFSVDFAAENYRTHPLHDLMVAAFAPFSGRMHVETLAISRKLLEIIALFGGQWPHSSWMVPGGITGRPDAFKVVTAQGILDGAARWFESMVIGGPLEDWLALETGDALFAWNTAHPEAALSLLTRFARDIGLQHTGIGNAHYLSYGTQFVAEEWRPPYTGRPCRLAAGTLDNAGGRVVPLDQAGITEHVAHSWYLDYPGGLHPSAGRTVPNYPGAGGKYSWIKAPRYQGRVMQTGALAELLIAGEPLLADLLGQEQGNTWLRQFARLRRAGRLITDLRAQAQRILAIADQDFLNQISTRHAADGDGYGLLQAARGALGHWTSIRDGKIAHYQIITPTTWNASPRDSLGQPGYWEASLVGTRLADPDDPIEIGHIIRSHDPCFVCSVHMTDTGRRLRFGARG
jgi:Ni,Fe-hydrogenase I large subunit